MAYGGDDAETSAAAQIGALDAAAQAHMRASVTSGGLDVDAAESALACLSRSLALRSSAYGAASPIAAAGRETLAKFLNVRALQCMSPDAPDYDGARAFLAEALRLTGAEGDLLRRLAAVRASTLSNLAIYYTRIQRPAVAKKHLQSALHIESNGAPLPAPAPLPHAPHARASSAADGDGSASAGADAELGRAAGAADVANVVAATPVGRELSVAHLHVNLCAALSNMGAHRSALSHARVALALLERLPHHSVPSPPSRAHAARVAGSAARGARARFSGQGCDADETEGPAQRAEMRAAAAHNLCAQIAHLGWQRTAAYAPLYRRATHVALERQTANEIGQLAAILGTAGEQGGVQRVGGQATGRRAAPAGAHAHAHRAAEAEAEAEAKDGDEDDRYEEDGPVQAEAHVAKADSTSVERGDALGAGTAERGSPAGVPASPSRHVRHVPAPPRAQLVASVPRPHRARARAAQSAGLALTDRGPRARHGAEAALWVAGATAGALQRQWLRQWELPDAQALDEGAARASYSSGDGVKAAYRSGPPGGPRPTAPGARARAPNRRAKSAREQGARDTAAALYLPQLPRHDDAPRAAPRRAASPRDGAGVAVSDASLEQLAHVRLGVGSSHRYNEHMQRLRAGAARVERGLPTPRASSVAAGGAGTPATQGGAPSGARRDGGIGSAAGAADAAGGGIALWDRLVPTAPHLLAAEQRPLALRPTSPRGPHGGAAGARSSVPGWAAAEYARSRPASASAGTHAHGAGASAGPLGPLAA
ncbi:hypothetical protein KFE25_010490 [Diacronema lutheri]|uniref:Uncharacterized protein n=1 Tax=Diacronema lutheri TaxID=2081491 RepID=A0A8J6CBB4_DIALT|nr:hypothetical protein KFE25_010490 [Diacronema lutheri]